MIYVGAYVLFTVAGFCWFFHRMGDKLGRDTRWWVKTLDWVLITPLIPYFYLIGLLTR